MASRGALLSHEKSACDECWGCARLCPVKAIRVVDGHSEVIWEKCVKCGLCVNDCGRGGFRVRDDLGAVRELLRSRRPVIAMLASEFIAALHPMTVAQVERNLEALGFHAVETTLLGEEIVAEAYERLHTREGSAFTIRSTCPVAVDFVRKYYPALVPALAPIVPPYIAHARLIKELHEGDPAIVYVSPCYARKDEALEPHFERVVDVAIDFLELRQLIAEEAERPVRGSSVLPPPSRPGLLREVSLTDGFPRQTLASRNLTDASVHVVRGLPDIDRLLRAVTTGETAPVIIDMLNCEGCIDGPAVNPGLSLYAKRGVDASARQTPASTRVGTRALLNVLPRIETVRSFVAEPVAVARPSDDDIDAVLRDGGFTRETVLDCGACGWGTCLEQALAVYRGDSSWDLCFPLQRSKLAACEVRTDSEETLDALTGLWNRRAFSERLDVELARHVRYGSPLAVVFMDVDGFTAINEAHGEVGGDAVLIAVGERLAASIRVTDLAARWSGDQFALLLPGIGKTAAYAVAEKLRAAVVDSPITVSVDGYEQEVPLTVSAGVAAASPARADAMELLEAADGALHEAMDAGKDQVRLASG